MKRHPFTLTLFLILTTALILTACGGSALSDQPAPQSGEGSGVEETAETTEAASVQAISDPGEAASAQAVSEPEETTAAQAVSEPEGADRADTAAVAVPLSSDPCPSIPAEEYPKVDGSTATLPLSYALYQAATGADEETARAAVTHNKTDYSYRSLVYGSCDLVIAYEPSEQTKEYIEENGSLEMKPIGRDALVFMVNASNPVKSLTEEQIQAVYSGEITNWNELGGKDEEIVAFQRTQNSGSQTLMEKLVMNEIPMAEAPAYYYISSMGELLDKVSSYNNQGNAIGYSVYFYARNMYSVPGLEFLSVDGVAPSNDTIQDGSYPYVNEFYAAIRDDEPEDSPARLLFDWLTGEGGQELIAETGYVPVRDKRPAEGGAAPALVMTEKGETSYDLKEDQVILIDGNSWFNSPVVHIMNADMTERDLLEGYSLTMRKNVTVWSIHEPLVLMDASSGKKGLYDISGGKWILEPEYTAVNRNSCGDYFLNRSGGERSLYNGSGILQIENEYLCAGDYYWIKDETGYSIRKGGTEISGHVDVSDPEQSSVRSYVYNVSSPFVKLDPGTGREYLYTTDGELVFKPDFLQSAFEDWQDLPCYITGCTNAKGLLCIRIDEDDTTEYWIYDIETGDILLAGDENVKDILCNKKGDCAFQIESDSGLSILTDSLEPLKASDGTPYEYCFGMDCYGYLDPESGNIVVESLDGSIRFEMPFHEEGSYDNQGVMIARGVILYTDWEGKIFELTRYGELICSSDSYGLTSITESPGDYSSINRAYTELYMGEDLLVFRTDTGELTYRTSEGRIADRDYPVLVFRSGNYLNFRDPYGGLVMTIFADQYSGD